MMTCSPNLHPFYGCLFQEEERYPSPNIQRGNLGFDLLGSCTFLSAGRKDISSVVITCPPGSHKGSGVILQGKAAVDGSRYLPHQVQAITKGRARTEIRTLLLVPFSRLQRGREIAKFRAKIVWASFKGMSIRKEDKALKGC